MSETYRLSYENDGVYFETTELCRNENKDEILAYLKRKNLQQSRADRILKALENPPSRDLIAPPQKEYFFPEQAAITISEDQMEAYLSILPPDVGGGSISLQQLADDIRMKGVSYGIDESVLIKALEDKKYGEKICFAKGTMPEDGIDGELVFHFNLEQSAAPTINETSGRVDYKDLNLFVQVQAGEKLVSKKPATEGKPGYTVTGRLLKQKVGKEAKLPSGKNVEYDTDRNTMFASITGRVDYKNFNITISPCHTVSKDVDLSVGNISFDGDVIIKGSVISDIVIKASRNVEVYGVVEGAKIIAGGNIVLRSGILGNDKGVLEAGNDVIAKYIERTKVYAEGNILIDSMMHCRAESGRNIVAKGRHGSIIGGTIKAQNSVSAKNIGSVASNKTNIEVGISPARRTRLAQLKKEKEYLQVESDKFEKIINYLAHMENIPPDKEKMRKTIILKKIENSKIIGEYSKEIENLEEYVNKADLGKVHVTDTIYPGVRITISLGEYVVTTPIKFATFYCKDREITFSACQI